MWWLMHEGFGMHDGLGWGWMAFGAVWMVIFWGAIVALGLWAVSRLSGRQDERREPSPLDIALKRYARGELTREQFERLRDDLRES